MASRTSSKWIRFGALALTLLLVLIIGKVFFLESEVKVSKSYRYEISLAAITKDDHPYLSEWIDYHQLIGVNHFYIYDNNVTDETLNILQPYIQKGIVEYIRWPNQSHWAKTQSKAYNDALRKAIRVSKWISFLDTDEFIVPTKYSSLSETLKHEYETKPLIYVNWRLFGTSFITLTHSNSMLPFLIKCSNRDDVDNKIGKMIVRPEYMSKKISNQHFTAGLVGFVDGSGNPFPFSTPEEIYEHAKAASVNDDFLRINHYTFRDENFFHNVKIPRSIFFGRQPESEVRLNTERYNVTEDVLIQKVIAEAQH